MEDSQDKSVLKSFSESLFKKKNKSFDDKDWEKGPKVSRPTDEIYYDNTTNKHIGYALVFNQIRIKKLERREGSKYDMMMITKALQSYGFMVKLCIDYTKQKIYDTLSDYSEKDHSQNDCFVVVVMSHGSQDRIYAADKSYKVEKLWEKFLGDSCKSLINKPKLFFIQSCRGESVDPGTQYQTDTIDSSRSLNSILESEELSNFHIPHMADLLVYYSTFKNYAAWRHPIRGSFFIQALAQVLEHYAKTGQPIELYFLLTKVNSKVAYEYQTYGTTEKTHAKKQMPCIESTLTKIFLLERKVEMPQLHE